MNRTKRKIPCYTYLTFRSFFYWFVASKELLDYQLLLYHQRKAHRLDMIIKHHTSIHAIIHKANNRSKLEQYTNHRKIRKKKFEIRFYASLQTHRRERHANQSFGEKDTSTDTFALYAEKKTICFIYFNYIKAYINWIKSNLDSNYKTKVKQIIFYL